MARKKEPVAVTINQMFKKYDVTIRFRNYFAGGLPKDPEKILPFLNARKPAQKPEGAIAIEEIAEGTEELIPGLEEGEMAEEAALTTTFITKDGHLIYESRGVKSHIKDCASVLGGEGGIISIRNLKSRVANRVQVEPEYIPLTSADGTIITGTAGHKIKPITVFVRGQGNITAVKIVEYVTKAVMKFELKVLNDGVVTKEILECIFTYGGEIKGLGQDRNIGWGRYDFELTEIVDG